MVETSGALPRDLPIGLQAEAQVVGTEGAVFVDGSPRELMLHAEKAAHIDHVYTAALEGRPTGAAVDETHHFVRCARGEASPSANGEAGRAAVQLMVAAQHSLDEGEKVQL